MRENFIKFFVMLKLQLDELDLKFYIDASYAIHPNARSHSGLVVSLGDKYGSPILGRSIVKKLVAFRHLKLNWCASERLLNSL